MIHLSPSQRKILHLLGDACCHTGNELGQSLGVSRAAIWKQINWLIDIGVPINRLPHKGYQLRNPLILLEEQAIRSALEQKAVAQTVRLHLPTVIDSTNRYLKDLPASPGLDICCAELQTQGRGRFDRRWHSPFGENIYCSTRWQLPCDLAKLSGLSLVTSLAILAALKEISPSPPIKIKWPNDILWGDKKLCGSLIEIIAESNGNAQVIIGIGLNVNTDTKNQTLPDKSWCSLYEITEQYFDRNRLIAGLVRYLALYIDKFIHHDLNAFMEEWNQSDYLAAQWVTVNQSSGAISGSACGITTAGQLIVQDKQGTKHYLSSGDASLQPLVHPI